MKTVIALGEEIDSQIDELQALIALAEKEERELTDEEVSRSEELTASVESLRSKQEHRRKLDDQIKLQAASRLGKQIDEHQNQDAEPSLENFTIPAKAKAHKKLQAFDSERDAYVAGQVILAGIYGNANSQEWCSRHGLLNTMSGGISGAKGGFLVPDEMQRTLVRLREERGIFERYANAIPMGSDNITIPRLIGDVTSYWVGETDEITASDASLGAAELVAKKLACLTKVSTELDEDSVVEIGDMLTQSMAYSMADKIDEAGFNGDGTSTYGGVTGLKNALDSNAVNDAASGNTGASTLDLADFENTLGLYPQYPGASPVWFVNSAVYWASMGRLLDAAGGNAVSDLAGERQMMFLGYPVVFTQVLPATTGASASTILAYFGDLRLGATVGTRRSVGTQVSLDRYFENDLIGVRCTQRVAINVHERGDTVRTRPMVALKTAAS
jgi:HK97 family phage major capsid protein